MIREIRTGSDISILDEDFTKGLGKLTFYHPEGTFALTPASYILIEAIVKNQNVIKGIGMDWGSGIGCLAILAAKIDSVKAVYGLEISEENVKWARQNAEENSVSDKVCFMLADSYTPFSVEDQTRLNALKGKVDFILSNPPSSDWDDGFGFRRMVLEGAKDYLAKDGIVLLNVSFQYSIERVEALLKDTKGFSYMGVAATTEWVRFDLNRSDLMECLKVYIQEELKGGSAYTFFVEDGDETHFMNAQHALDYFNKTGKSPMTKWQTHLFKYTGIKEI